MSWFRPISFNQFVVCRCCYWRSLFVPEISWYYSICMPVLQENAYLFCEHNHIHHFCCTSYCVFHSFLWSALCEYKHKILVIFLKLGHLFFDSRYQCFYFIDICSTLLLSIITIQTRKMLCFMFVWYLFISIGMEWTGNLPLYLLIRIIKIYPIHCTKLK